MLVELYKILSILVRVHKCSYMKIVFAKIPMVMKISYYFVWISICEKFNRSSRLLKYRDL